MAEKEEAPIPVRPPLCPPTKQTEGGEPAADAAAAAEAKKREANRKKKARQKAAKQRQKEVKPPRYKSERHSASIQQLSASQQAANGGETKICPLVERRESTCGQGLFAIQAAPKGTVLVNVVPALSVVFDQAAKRVCGFCFRHTGLLATCSNCQRLALCASCRDKGLLDWHSEECEWFQKLPASSKNGDTSIARMLLRYRSCSDGNRGEWCDVAAARKEPLSSISTLQANPIAIPAAQIKHLGQMTGVPDDTVAHLIYQIRCNAAALDRDGKCGCALSVHMGYCNHSCAPNTEATITVEDGRVTLKALEDIPAGGEITISYIDRSLPLADRRKVLQSHYGFECHCPRCTADKKQALREKIVQRGR